MTAPVSRFRTRRLTGGVLATLAGVIALAAPHSALAASSSTSFADASGDAPAAIDITAATFSSDATAIVFTQRLRDAAAVAPLFAFAPEYSFAFKTPRDSFGVQRVGTATTVFGNANDTHLDISINGGDDTARYFGTRTLDFATSTVSLRFERTAIGAYNGDGVLSPGALWIDLTARNHYQQDLLGRADSATAPPGTIHTVGG